ncbi:NACHT domain-containing protein [Mastigocoleus testarum]|uniref:Uncharacterized protein n=1 Tax=Mastigocoleus testarum BC008 TaxID=371196 RepID=A0A0V7ZUP4_9CYAN|nr:NACHT domain-containing protein [Mastigocoleus testarum]KST68053.1 hypothetical protein BC008_32250 [Mastigocoleus testarum BC008]KST68323.1 hypothetical protein BC008_32880 [Mastigocoleus testarum BC008]
MSSNEELRAIFDRIADGEETEDDIKTLRRILRLRDGSIQVGKDIVNIADGRNIQIGDRIYYGTDAETIKEVLHLVLQEKQKAKRPRNEKLLLQAVKEEVKARLKGSLHNAVLINLGKEAQPEQVKCPWSSDIKIGNRKREPIPHSTSILEVFEQEEIADQLLILGDPGAGKTTTMLDLAESLIVRAQKEADYPIPVLLNLSNWKDDEQSIHKWLVLELNSKYGVRQDVGTNWVDEAKLLPMLDGLDELESIRQEPCVQKINEFLQSESRSQYLVVCSRREEYEKVVRQQIENDEQDLEETSPKQETRLHLNGAIVLQPLTDEKIKTYLAQLNQIEFWETLQDDAELLRLLRKPLFLSILGFISFDKNLSLYEWGKLTPTKERIQSLLDAYWETAIGRELVTSQMESQGLKSLSYRNKNPPSRRKTRKWLVYLAQQLQEESQTEFLIEEMQPYLFLKKKHHQWLYWFLLFAINTLCVGIISTSALLPYFQPPNNFVIIQNIFIGLFGVFMLTAETKADGVRLIEYPWIHLFCWLFKRDLPKEFKQHVPIIHDIDLSQKLKIRIPSLQEIERYFIFPLKGLFLVHSKFSLMPIVVLMYGTHMMSAKIMYVIGAKKRGLKQREDIVQISLNVNSQMKEFRQSSYSHHYLIFLLTINYLEFIEQQGGFLLNFILNLIGKIFSVFSCGLIAPFIFISLFLVKPIENSNIPNQGFYETLKIALIVTWIQGFYIYYIISSNIKQNIWSTAISFTLWILLSFSFSSLAKHLSLRTILYCNGYIPWNYAHFLDYCTERLFLQRIGGRYRFIHRLLQEYFAAMTL